MTDDWAQRLIYEYAELKIRLFDLKTFLNVKLVKDDNAKLELLKRQLEIMKEYAKILEQRIAML
jgi:hypothetical protein